MQIDQFNQFIGLDRRFIFRAIIFKSVFQLRGVLQGTHGQNILLVTNSIVLLKLFGHVFNFFAAILNEASWSGEMVNGYTLSATVNFIFIFSLMIYLMSESWWTQKSTSLIKLFILRLVIALLLLPSKELAIFKDSFSFLSSEICVFNEEDSCSNCWFSVCNLFINRWFSFIYWVTEQFFLLKHQNYSSEPKLNGQNITLQK